MVQLYSVGTAVCPASEEGGGREKEKKAQEKFGEKTILEKLKQEWDH